jgi:hypothetical protein
MVYPLQANFSVFHYKLAYELLTNSLPNNNNIS